MRVWFVGCLFSLAWAVSARANTEHFINSPDGQRPYMVVTSDDGPSARAAGIFVADEQGRWHSSLPGKILTGRLTHGILTQLDIRTFSQRYEGIAILDGKLTIFSVNTRAADKDSFAVLGDSTYPLQDVMHSQEVRMPAITSVEDVQIFAGRETKHGQLILISVKEKSLHGTGVTIAVYLKAGTARDSKLSLAGAPVVIDYEFQDVNKLRLLSQNAGLVNGGGATGSSEGVISKLLVQSLARRAPTDPQVVALWKTELLRKLKETEQGKETAGLPYYDVKEGISVLPALIKDYAGDGSVSRVYQVYDPLSGMNGLVFEPSSARSRVSTQADYALVGRLDLKPDGKTYRLHTSQDDKSILLAYVNRELTFIQDGDTPYLLRLEKAGAALPDELSFVVLTKPKKDGEQIVASDKNFIFLILSTKTGPEKKTELVYLRKVAASYEIVKRFTLMTEYLDYASLKARTRWLDNRLLFDTLTPIQPSLAAYDQSIRETMPYLDLTYSHQDGESQVQSYLKALEDREINRFLHYRVYDKVGAIHNQTGLFVTVPNRARPESIPGELLIKDGQPTTELYSRPVKFGKNPEYSTRFTLVALDTAYAKGKNSFKMVFLSTPEGPEAFAPVRTDVNFSAPFPALAGVQVVQGRKRNADLVYVFLRFTPVPDHHSHEARTGGVFAQVFKLIPERRNDVTTMKLDVLQSRWILQGTISDSEFRHRLRRETTEGRVFVTSEPDGDGSSSGFKLHDIALARDVFPNSSAERAHKYAALQDDEDGERGQGLGSGRALPWEIGHPHRLKERLEKLVPRIADKDLADAAKEEEAAFPDLQRTLDRVASSTEASHHQVFLVPSYLKSHWMRAALYLWADKDRPKHDWSQQNYRMNFHVLDTSKATQEEVLEHLELLRRLSPPDRGVLFADMKDVVAVGRPQAASSEHPPFQISDPARADGDEGRFSTPHLLYLLGTEGETIDLKDFETRRATWTNRFASVLVATPSEWAQVQQNLEPEARFGLLKRFKLNTQYYHGSWRLWAPGTQYASAKVKELEKQPVSDFEREVFPSLSQTLTEAADASKPPRHRILLVPPELRNNIVNLVLARWIHSKSDVESWSRGNGKLQVYHLAADKAAEQDDILENLQALRSLPAGSRGVLVGDLADVAKVGRTSKVGAIPFRLKDMAAQGPANTGTGGVSITQTEVVPHLLYLLGTEGRRLQLAEFEAAPPEKESAMILVGTQQEWEQMQRDLTPEGRVGLAERFEVTELPIPSPDTRKQLLRRVLERPEIAGLRYTYDASRVIDTNGRTLGQDEILDAILGYMVSRCELLAKKDGKEVITTFIQYLNTFALSLVQDEVLRRRRVIDRVFVERLFSKIFNMALNVNVLPPDDPLVRISQPDRVMQLQEAGYEGALELKAKVLEAILAQTRHDPVRPIPSSIILYGASRTGKTFLFKTICKWLGLQMYDFAKPTEVGAQAIIINVGKLKADNDKATGNENTLNPATSESMTVKEAFRHLHNFLSLPNGYRGFILFDDVHAATDEVKAEVLTQVRALFEATGGIYRVHAPGKNPMDIPVRNLVVGMTLNPTDDWAKISRFRKSGSTNNDLEMVLASLAGNGDKGYTPERSFLERWSLILNLNQFPSDAMAPKLRDGVREAARDPFNNQNMLVMVSPSAIRSVAKQFDTENANFLSKATPELIARATESSGRDGLMVVIPAPSTRFLMPDGPAIPTPTSYDASGRTANIEAFIRSRFVAVPVKGRFDGQLEFLRILVDIFRTQLMEVLVKAVSQDRRYAETAEQRRDLLAPVLHSVLAHITLHPDLPVRELSLDPFEFGARASSQQTEFQRVLEAQSDSGPGYFPVRFGDEIGFGGMLRELLDHTVFSERERNRAQILSEYVDKAGPILNDLLAGFLRRPSSPQLLEELPHPAEWIKALPSSDGADPTKRTGQQLSELFLEFYQALFHSGLTETMAPQNYASIATYDAVRLFLLVIDKAITKMSWGKTQGFLQKALDLATKDMALGQSPGLQHYLFGSKFSLARPSTRELLVQTASNSAAFKEWTDVERKRADARFSGTCGRMLVQSQEVQ